MKTNRLSSNERVAGFKFKCQLPVDHRQKKPWYNQIKKSIKRSQNDKSKGEIKMEERMIKAQELAYKVGVSVQTISAWYRFKQENPNNEYSLMLPDYVRIGAQRTRYWKEADVKVLRHFRESIPQGRHGVLGSVTQRYVKSNFRYAGSEIAKRESVQKTRARKEGYIDKTMELLMSNGVEPEMVMHVVKILKEEREWRLQLNGEAAM